MKKQIKQLVQDKKGANVVEYIILLALIAIVVIAAVRTFGESVSSKFNEKESDVQGL